jgi:hypothetical protein
LGWIRREGHVAIVLIFWDNDFGRHPIFAPDQLLKYSRSLQKSQGNVTMGYRSSRED